MEKIPNDDEISTSSVSSSESNNIKQDSNNVEVTQNPSKPVLFSWMSPKNEDDDSPPTTPSIQTLEPQHTDSSKIITHEPTLPPDTWLLGGCLGSRNAILVFKSSALANASELSMHEKPGYKLHITYKVLQAETKLLSKLLECHGISEVATNSSDFNLLWTGSHPKPGTLRNLAPHQRVNHFPRSYELTRKDRLYKNIEKMQHAKGYKHFDFIPQTFVMPTEFQELCSTHHRIKGPWIVKPVASSRGRGIFIVETPNQVPLEEPVVVAKYISKPLLVRGHKCDLRLYVAVTSMDPLLVYIYEEGLVRFATVKYDSSHKQLWNPCMHLCNYSINKYHSDYVKSDDPSAENVGHKWTLSALLRHLKSQGKDTALLMSQIEDLVIKAVLASGNSIISACKMFVPNPNNCFELYGFDILIDENLKPWLLEVNLSPSLGCDSPLDVRLKSAMLADLLTLVGIPAVDPVLRPSTNTSYTSATSKTSTIKDKFGHCRRVHSADGLSNTLPKKSSSRNSGRLTSSSFTLSAEESRIIKVSKSQFERRGGFVRIFPAVDSWNKYCQYLDPSTGIPVSGNTTTMSNYNLSGHHNYNLLLHNHFFPEMAINGAGGGGGGGSGTSATGRPPADHYHHHHGHNNHSHGSHHNNNHHNNRHTRYSSLDRQRSGNYGSDHQYQHAGNTASTTGHHVVATAGSRQDRYERMLSQGHRSALLPKKILRDSHTSELRKQIIEMLKAGKKMTQCETRKTFSHYLACVLTRISAGPDQEDHVDIVLKFLQKASNYLRTPYSVKTPSQKLDGKDRAAIVAKQLNDFLYLYNRETELFVDKVEKPSQIPMKLYSEFLEHARECDLEEVLIHQTTLTVPTHGAKTGFQGILKCIPNVPKSYGIKPPYKTLPKAKGLKVSSLS